MKSFKLREVSPTPIIQRLLTLVQWKNIVQMKKYISCILLIFCFFALTSCGTKTAGPPTPPPLSVNTKTLALETLYDSSKYLATLKSRKAVVLSAELTAKVESIYVQSGDKVSAGSLLIKLRSGEEESSLRSQGAQSQARAESVNSSKQVFESYKARKKESDANLRLAQSQYQRYKTLFVQQMVSKNQLEDYENKLSKAQSDSDSINADIQSKKYDVAEAENNFREASSQIGEKKARIDKLRITAPFSGTVGDIPVKVGDLTLPGNKLVSIANVEALELYVYIPAEKAASVSKDSIIEILNSQGEIIGSSNIFFVSPTVEADSQTVLVKALLKNPENLFRDGQEVNSRIKWGEKKGLLIPTSAVSRFGGNAFVFLVQTKKNSKINEIISRSAKQVQVKLGDMQDGQYQILSGLKPRRKLITSGIQKLSDGAPINLIEENNPPK
jgi:RND family efflux transporter MFP subunit